VHYDGKEFYKPVFDTIVFSYSQPDHVFSVFLNEDGEQLARVVLDKKKMFLTPGKKLKPGNYFLKGYDDKNEIYQDAIDEMVDPADEGDGQQAVIADDETSAEVERFSTPAGMMRIEQVNDTLHFYLGDNEISEFKALEYSKLKRDQEPVQYLFIRPVSSLKYGIASIEQKKLIVPAEYDQLQWENRYKAIWASQKNKTGVIDAVGKVIVPLKYDNIVDGFLLPDGSRVFNTMDINSRSFRLVWEKNNIVTESSVHYDWLESVMGSGQLLFIASKNKKIGVITPKDSVVVPLKYENVTGAVSHIDDKRFFILQSTNGQLGFADPDNKFLRVEPAYNRIGEPMPVNIPGKKKQVYVFSVRRNGNFFYIDNYGREFISK
jgi:hypothetical protein